MAEAAFRLPEKLNITEGNIAENFRKWKRQVEIYMSASGTAAKDNVTQVAIILHCAGPHVVELFDQFTWDNEDDDKDPDKVLKKLEKYCNPRANEVIESHRFWCVPWQEPFDIFLTELRHRADRCNFGALKDRLIRDKIIFSCQGKLQLQLLKDDSNTLEGTIKLCRAFEQSANHVKELRDGGVSVATKVNKVTKAHRKTSNSNRSQHSNDENKKPGAGRSVKPSRPKKPEDRHGNDTQCEDSDDDNYHWLSAVKSKPRQNVSACMIVNEQEVRFQLDSAADVNTINQKFVRKTQVRPTSITLKMWNKSDLKPLGEADLEVTNAKTGEAHNVTFVVVPNGLMCLLGLQTVQEMGLVTINNSKIIAAVNQQQLGDLGEASLKVNPEIPAKALPCRKIPIALQDEVKRELDSLVARNVLVPVTEPNTWVSQMAVVHKSNGKLRICIDPQALNTALMREHYKLPVLDDVLPKLSKARCFSKLDVKDAYWHVRLDEESSKLTTMITPFGRFRWARLPFGLKVSSEIFHRKITEALGDLDGVFTIADDIIVAGCGSDDSAANRDNDRKLRSLYKRCKEQNITLNEDKKAIGLREISFHGHSITSDGVKPDDKKIKAIMEMPAPEDVSGVKRFCGVVQYMAKFLPDLAITLEPIRALTRKDVEWNWSKDCQTAFDEVKRKLTKAPVLAYFDANKEVVVQVDSSQHGIGAVLVQCGQPIEFASRSLTTSERNWAQIEKEALAILFGLERFDQYTYGRAVTIQNDHKPLASILKKPLSDAPKRLQNILVRLNRYDFEFHFVKGMNLTIADALSRAELVSETEPRPRIMSVNAFSNIPDARLEEVREATEKDPGMQELVSLILCGWPSDKASVPAAGRPYFDFRDTLGYHDGIVMKGESVVIPQSLRTDMKARLHSAHLAYDSIARQNQP
ncbi:uncharacterized protein LOC132557483 [Ylistrum balloti]|uniref:uncharacterized protein LOC132557483 n=1 Tax=Ylistrum balloti TaxID=509963 RepID=UPI002905C9EA|nr:uncharacterized protein LOC132557483 [Ylistrum balloti]